MDIIKGEELARIASIHPASDINRLVAMDNRELHLTYMACKMIYRGQQITSKAVCANATGVMRKSRQQVVVEILKMRAEWASLGKERRARIVAEG